VDPIIVVGLGNPGTEYESTRHNIGFRVIDALARRLKTPLKPGNGEYLFASRSVEGKDVILAKPLTYMNNSGNAVGGLLERYSARLDELVVIVDDIALPLGVIRVRAKGSDGGHNGLASIIYQLNTNEFPRIRCGIRQEMMPPKEQMADFVLSPFETGERETAEAMISRASDAVLEFSIAGIARTMSKFNTQPGRPDEGVGEVH
jgi:PTH1 family peptidyl-tRNA hydrolase